MDFTGKYEVQSQENMEPFFKAIGFPDEMFDKLLGNNSVNEIEQNGKSFKTMMTVDSNVIENKFTLGEEVEMDYLTGEKIKAVFSMDGDNRLVAKLKGITSVAELCGDTLINTLTLGDITGTTIMKRV